MNEIEKLNERISQLTELVKSGEETISATKEMLKLAEQERDKLADQRNNYDNDTGFRRVKYGSDYFAVIVNEFGVGTFKLNDTDRDIDKDYYEVNNYFKTRERATEVLEKINLLLKLERLHDIYCPNSESGKYYISQNTESGRYCYGYIRNVPNKFPTSTMFPSEEIAQKVCDILNAELMGEKSNDY